jgi:hypothetical protein
MPFDGSSKNELTLALEAAFSLFDDGNSWCVGTNHMRDGDVVRYCTVGAVNRIAPYRSQLNRQMIDVLYATCHGMRHERCSTVRDTVKNANDENSWPLVRMWWQSAIERAANQ